MKRKELQNEKRAEDKGTILVKVHTWEVVKGTGKGGRFIKKEKRSRMEARIEASVERCCLVVPYKPCKN